MSANARKPRAPRDEEVEREPGRRNARPARGSDLEREPSAPRANARRARERDTDHDEGADRDESGARPIAKIKNRRTAPKPGTTPSVAPPPAPRRRPLGERLSRVRERIAAILARARAPLAFIGRVLVIAASIAGAIALFRVVERHVRTSPAFAAREIVIEGEERLSEGAIAEAAGLTLGQNVFDVAPDDARRALLAHPWIADADVRRRLPGRWSIEVRERSPAAILMIGEGWLVDAEGAVFKRAQTGDPVDLPVITGIDRERFTADRPFRTRVLLAVIALLGDWRAAGLWRREPIAEIHVELDDSLTLRIGDDATEVRLGHGPYRAKLDRLRRVLDELARREARPAYVHLDATRRPDRVVVRVR
jgi:cell division protein FtsQ